MKCKDCGKDIQCSEHGDKGLSEFQHDDKSWVYSCGTCIEEGAGAFGSIIHWCKDAFGLFSEKDTEIDTGDFIISTKGNQRCLFESNKQELSEGDKTC